MSNENKELFPFETLEQCRTYYCKPFPQYITCKDFGELDGMNGSCHWCKEMTPIQFEMCWDESMVHNSMNRGTTRREAIERIKKEKEKHCTPTSMFISINRMGVFDVKVFHKNDYASMELTFEQMISSLEEIIKTCNVREVYLDIVRLGVLYACIESIIAKEKSIIIHKITPSDLQSKLFESVKKSILQN